ncbi:sulfurtransferase TusA family protein [Devosia sp. SL43]|nr:sulfurtransferase TusA family protein [Devosia sp. SL43]UJW83963.1 sulfurtransferase TusA family protein [Devosia sp. SL43]
MAFTGCLSLTNEVIDARGLKCPLPVLKMEKRLATLPPGATLTVLATDPMAKIDIPLHCRQHGHTYVLASEGDVLRFDIVKG